MAKIVIVTSSALGSNPRVVKEAQTLHAAGHNVLVISVRTLASVDQRDDDVLSNASWKSIRLDFQARRQYRRHRLMQLVFERAFALTQVKSLADQAHSPFTAALTKYARASAADLYIAHYPAALPAAANAAKLHGASYAYDAEDYYLGDVPDGDEYEPARRSIRAIEERYLPDCAYVTAAAPGIAEAYVAQYAIKRPSVILNTFPRAHAPATWTLAGTAHPGPSVYWFSQTIGPNRGLETAVQAIATAQSRPHLYLRGGVMPDFLSALQDLAAKLGVSNQLHILEPAVPSEMEHLAAAFDIGLAAETGHTTNRQVALTNKLFTYLLAGVAIAMSDIQGHAAMANDLGHAAMLYRIDDPKSLAMTFDSFLLDRAKLANARKCAFELGQTRYCWEHEVSRVTHLIDDVLEAVADKRSQAN